MTYVNYAKVGEVCPCCGQGSQLIALDKSSGKIFVSCDDCFSEWDSMDKIKSCDLATRGAFGAFAYMLPSDLVSHAWYHSILNK